MKPSRVAVLLWAVACGGGGGDGPAAQQVPPEMELGTGEITFTPVGEGDELEVIFGPQGGYHVLGAVRTKGIEPGDPEDLDSFRNPILLFDLFIGEERVNVRGSYIQGLRPVDLGDESGFTHQLLNRFVVLDITDDDDVAGQTARFELALEDGDGNVYTDAHEVLLVKHPFND